MNQINYELKLNFRPYFTSTSFILYKLDADNGVAIATTDGSS